MTNANGNTAHWYALLTETGRERRAKKWLEIRQFAPYWPHYQGTVKLNRHRRGVRPRGVIPGYIFLPLNGEKPNWRLILRTPGVREVVRDRASYEPVCISGREMELLMNTEESLNQNTICASEGIPFKIGQIVRCSNDLYSEFVGPIIAIDTRRRISVSLPLFGSKGVRVVVSADEIEPI